MIQINRLCEKTIWLLTVLWLAATYIFYSATWGRYLYLALAVLIFLLTAVHGGGKVRLPFRRYHLCVLLFALYCLASSLWAWTPEASVASFRTLFSILVCCSLMYPYYSERDSIEELAAVFMWAGYIVALYSIFYYGFDNLYEATASADLRLGNAYNNVNSIGMLCAFAFVIQFYKILFYGLRLSAVFSVPTLLVVAAMQSRKAILVVVLGAFLVLVLKNIGNRKFLSALGRVLLIVALFAVLVLVLSQLRIFGGVNERLKTMLASFTGEGNADHSSLLRAKMRTIGMEQFRKTPFFGIGMGNSAALLLKTVGLSTYLHNNYVELLACGGLAGFALYYVPMLACGVCFLRRKRFTQKQTAICAVLLLLLLIMDYGMVSYSSKEQYLYLMLFFIQADRLDTASRTAPRR